jgi:DNA-binding response OmpR family regulator
MLDPAAALHEVRPRILLIEDDEGVRRSLQLLLHWHGYDVRSFGSALPVLQDDHAAGTDILLTDYVLPDGNGISVLATLRSRGWAGRAVLITALPSEELEQRARASGFDVVMEKPLHQRELIAAINAFPPTP